MKFYPGDPVWAHTEGLHTWRVSAGEYAAVVLDICTGQAPVGCHHSPERTGYVIDVLSVPCPVPNQTWCASSKCLRPRRDDYQQHEPLSTRTNLDRILSTPQPVQEWTKETAVSGY